MMNLSARRMTAVKQRPFSVPAGSIKSTSQVERGNQGGKERVKYKTSVMYEKVPHDHKCFKNTHMVLLEYSYTNKAFHAP